MKTFIIGLVIGGVCGWLLAAGQFNRYEVHASGPYSMNSTKYDRLTGRTTTSQAASAFAAAELAPA